MSKLLIALFVTAGLGLAGCATQRDAAMTAAKPMAPVVPISKDAYDTAVRNADTQNRMDKDACSSRSGNAKDICLAEANGKEKVAKADAEAAYRNTPIARESARVTRAEATYGVAKEKCDDLAGNTKDVCAKEADAALVKAKADAKVDRVAAATRQDAATARKRTSTSATRITRLRSRNATRSRGPRRIHVSARQSRNTASPEIEITLVPPDLKGDAARQQLRPGGASPGRCFARSSG